MRPQPSAVDSGSQIWRQNRRHDASMRPQLNAVENYGLLLESLLAQVASMRPRAVGHGQHRDIQCTSAPYGELQCGRGTLPRIVYGKINRKANTWWLQCGSSGIRVEERGTVQELLMRPRLFSADTGCDRKPHSVIFLASMRPRRFAIGDGMLHEPARSPRTMRVRNNQ